MILTRKERSMIRRSAGCARSGSPSIEIIPGDQEPTEEGFGFRYETKGGIYIAHPSTYSKTGWSNMVYIHSSRRVEVGENFLQHYGLGNERREKHGE